MSEFKGTPGPWHEYANRQRRPYIAGADGALVAFIESDDDVEDANAALIAAAPTMHEYITKRADAGDSEAKQILESINAGR